MKKSPSGSERLKWEGGGAVKAVIYARYSSHNQREESIDVQLRECHDFAKKNDMLVIGEYCDKALTGKTDKRPDFQRLIRDSAKGKFEFVITYKVNRFARNRYDAATYKSKLKKNGVRVVYAKESIPDGPEGILLESMLEGYAEYYSENLKQDIIGGLEDNALKCKVNGGNIALGYKIGADQHFEIDPATAPIVREIFEMYASGMNITQITDAMNDKGLKTSRGNEFNKNSLRKMLRNEKYIGVYQYRDIRIEDGVPPIVDRALFEEVQAMIEKTRKAPAMARTDVDYLLTTKLFCGRCGGNMIGESGTSRHGTVYHYYKCNNNKRRRICDKKAVKKDWIEELVVRETVEQVLQDGVIAEIADAAMALQDKEKENTILHSMEQQLKDTEKGIKNVMNAIEQGIITSSTKDRLMDLEAQRDDLIVSISKEQIKKPRIERDQIIFWLEKFRGGDYKDKAYQRTVIDAFVNAVYLYDDEIRIAYNYTGPHNTVTRSIIENCDKSGAPECSTLASCAPPKNAYSNPSIYVMESVFVLIMKLPAA